MSNFLSKLNTNKQAKYFIQLLRDNVNVEELTEDELDQIYNVLIIITR